MDWKRQGMSVVFGVIMVGTAVEVIDFSKPECDWIQAACDQSPERPIHFHEATTYWALTTST